jgi:D-alanyl-D-alanine carboxypeptidase/D-alanyl-D-alanine-endopeptidase (penicillin-binding protein 4)
VAVLDQRGRLVFGRNADRLFTPASNTKLVVTATAAALLGPTATVTTSVYGDGPIVGSTLAGNLVIYGRGDPTWTKRCYALDTLSVGACRADPFEPLRILVSALRRRGLERIAGAVIGDGSFFEPMLVHPTWENDDLVYGYGAPVSALGFSENAVVATITSGRPGESAVIELVPDIGGLTIENRVTTVDSGTTSIEWRRSADGATAIASGTIQFGAEPERDQLAVVDPNRFAALALTRVLADSGIAVLGGIATTTDSIAFAAARRASPLAEVASRPLGDWLFPILNVSQNWVAEMLLKQLGARFGTGGSWSAGIEVERRFLIDSVGLDSTQFVIQDGSGLSAKNGISPLAFARLLSFMRRHPDYQAFAAGIPRSGLPGSLRSRFRDTPIAERVRAKTGSIGQVNSLSGYLDASEPDRAPCRVFSVQANHHALGGRVMIQAIDSVVVEFARAAECSRAR